MAKYFIAICKEIPKIDDKFSPVANKTKCLIFDDTSIFKTGKSIEGVSKIHDHISKKFILGYKLLVSGYWNGAKLWCETLVY